MSTSVKISENNSSQKSICFRLLIHVISWMPPNLVRKYVVPIFLSFVCHDINVYDNLLCRPGGTNIWGQLGFGPSNFSSCKIASVSNWKRVCRALPLFMTLIALKLLIPTNFETIPTGLLWVRNLPTHTLYHFTIYIIWIFFIDLPKKILMIHILVLFLFKLQFIQVFSQPSSWKPGESSGAFILKKYDENFDDFLAKLYGKLPNDSMIQDYMEKKEIFTITKPTDIHSKWTISVKGGNFLFEGCHNV